MRNKNLLDRDEVKWIQEYNKAQRIMCSIAFVFTSLWTLFLFKMNGIYCHLINNIIVISLIVFGGLIWMFIYYHLTKDRRLDE